jgi:hypothetical protein
MRQRRTILVVAALVVGLVSPPPALAADTSPPELVDVTLSTSAVTVSGLDFERVTVSVHLTDDTGVVAIAGDEFDPRSPSVTLARDAESTDTRYPRLTSGTAADGIWSVDVLVPSTYDGTWRVTEVAATDGLSYLSVDPQDLGLVRTLDVTGTHQPRLAMWFRPHPAIVGRPVSVRGRLTFADTGEPIGGKVLFSGFLEGVCGRGGPRVVSNANGFYEFTVPDLFEFPTCVTLIAPVPARPTFDPNAVAFIAKRTGTPQVRALVVARPSRVVVSLGRRIRIDGNVRPQFTTGRVLLQRWTVAGWRVEATAVIRLNGRYTIYAVPPRLGAFRYRVLKPSSPPFLAHGASRVMILKAT